MTHATWLCLSRETREEYVFIHGQMVHEEDEKDNYTIIQYNNAQQVLTCANALQSKSSHKRVVKIVIIHLRKMVLSK